MIINGGFAAFQAYHEALKLMSGQGGMSGGAWAFAQYEETKSKSTMTREIPTIIKVGNLTINGITLTNSRKAKTTLNPLFILHCRAPSYYYSDTAKI